MIKDLKELEKLLKICRKQGVSDIKWGDVELKLGDLPRDGTESAEESFPVTPTDEELLFWSSQPDPLTQGTEQ